MDLIDEIKMQQYRDETQRNRGSERANIKEEKPLNASYKKDSTYTAREKTYKTIWGIRYAALASFILSAISFSVVLIKLMWDTWQASLVYILVGLALIGIGVLIQGWHSISNRNRHAGFYGDKERTPLKWHKAASWILLFSILYNISETTGMDFKGLFFTLIQSALAITMIVGLLRFRKFGFYLLYINFVIVLASAVVISVLSHYSEAIIVLYLAILSPWIPTLVYYYKRFPLFD